MSLISSAGSTCSFMSLVIQSRNRRPAAVIFSLLFSSFLYDLLEVLLLFVFLKMRNLSQSLFSFSRLSITSPPVFSCRREKRTRLTDHCMEPETTVRLPSLSIGRLFYPISQMDASGHSEQAVDSCLQTEIKATDWLSTYGHTVHRFFGLFFSSLWNACCVCCVASDSLFTIQTRKESVSLKLESTASNGCRTWSHTCISRETDR